MRRPCVVGFERPFFQFLRRDLEEMGLNVSGYEGLLEASGSAPNSQIIAVHVDRHGLQSTAPGEYQYAAHTTRNRADLEKNSISQSLFDKITDRFVGEQVQAYEPWTGTHLSSGKISEVELMEHGQAVFRIPDLVYPGPGVPIAFLDRLEIDETHIRAQLDNALSVALAIDLLRSGFQGTVLFTAQEEVGRSWRFLLDWYRRQQIQSQELLVLDTSPFSDDTDVGEQDLVLRSSDSNAAFAPAFTKKLEAACTALDVSFRYKDRVIEANNQQLEEEGDKPRPIGSTELGRLIEGSDGELNGSTLQIPTTGYHTSEECAAITSVAAAREVLAELCLV